jgi:uncharacterized iron-regulated membrane protein
MSTGLVIAIVIAAAIVLFLLAAMAWRARAEREIERRRVVGEWGAHRDVADAKRARVQELGAQAEVHREAAAEHAALADEHNEAAVAHAEQAQQVEREISSADAAAARHEAEAKEREERLG